jgi:DNA repair protein RadC
MVGEPLEVSRRSTAALLARIMGLRGTRGVARASRLLHECGGRIRGLPTTVGGLGPEEDRDGVGPAALERLAAALELGRRMEAELPPERLRMRGPEDVVRLFAPRLRHLAHEEFHVVSLNTRHRVLGTHLVSRGLVDASLVHPREVFAPALELRASAVILVHNHPSGDPDPSPEDRRVTEQMAEAGEVLGVRVLDHVVVGDPGWRTVPLPAGRL